MSRLLMCLIVLSCLSPRAQDRFLWDDRIQRISDAVTSMRIPEARKWIQAERVTRPDNLCIDILESHADLYELYFNESREAFRASYPLFSKRIERFEDAPGDSPFRGYGLGVIHLCKALAAIRFEKNLDAAWDIRKSYLYLRDNRRKHPGFSPNDVFFGLLSTLLGSLPNNYQWFLNIIGMTGDINGGISMVHGYILSKGPYRRVARDVAMLVYPYLVVLYEGKPDKALKFLDQAGYDFKNNHLHAYMATNLQLVNNQARRSVETAEGILKSDAYIDVPFWHFEKGFGYLNQMKLDQSEAEFLRFVGRYRGNFYMKDAYEKLSWIAYLRNDRMKADEYRKRVLQKGSTVTDADKTAMRNAESGGWPHPLLLKARLLSDGGLFRESMEALKGKTMDDFQNPAHKAELAYRIGRNLDLMGDRDLAIRHYDSAIGTGRDVRDYFAARSALQAALIFEEKRDYTKANAYFKTALSMKDHPYKNSIDQKAKSGVYRCNMALKSLNGRPATR